MESAHRWMDNAAEFGANMAWQPINNATTNLTRKAPLMDTVAETQITISKNVNLSTYNSNLHQQALIT